MWCADGREEYGWWVPANEKDAYFGRCGCEGEA
jgi:hypothetical protein